MREIDLNLQFSASYRSRLVLDADYSPFCDKYWHKNDKVIIFEGRGHTLSKVYESDLPEINTIRTQTLNIVLRKCKSPVGIEAAHYIPDFSNTQNIADGPLTTARLALMAINDLYHIYDIYSDFVIFVNDLFMLTDKLRIDLNTINRYRESLFYPYRVPYELLCLLYEQKQTIDYKVYLTTEKNMAGKFSNHIKNRKYKDKYRFEKDVNKNIWYVITEEGDRIPVIEQDKPDCVAANAALLRYFNWENPRKLKRKYKTGIFYFPLCSIENVLNGHRVAHTIYNMDILCYYIFITTKCY